jgi:nucleoside-diphosphate-sugar epimerase
MRVVVIGGTGHIGTYLIPRLVAAGHEVVSVTRGRSRPYSTNWDGEGEVTTVVADRDVEDAAGTFGSRIRDLEPEVVVDLISFSLESAEMLVESLRGQLKHLLHCGTIWVHGPTRQAPTTEDEPRRPFGSYGVQKAAIEELLIREARRSGIPATVLHPGHIVGPGWCPINPAGNLSPEAFNRLANGEPLPLPNLGMETLHHVHADDVAQAFVRAIANRDAALGESFHVVSPAALTLRGYAESVAGWFGQPTHLRFLPWDEWKLTASAEEAALTWDHIAHSPCCSSAKAMKLLGYEPRYTSLDAIYESLSWLLEHEVLRLPGLGERA